MGSIGKGFLLILFVILAVLSLMLVEAAFAQTTEPSVPGSPGVGGFSVQFLSNGTTLGIPIEVGVSAFYPNGYYDKDFTGHISFSASKGTINPSTSGAFTEGSWRGLINMSEAGSDIVVYVNDGNGHTGRSAPISVYQMNLTPTSSANSTPTPSVPEFSWLAILPVFIFILSIAIIIGLGLVVYFRKHKPNNELAKKP